TADQAHDAYHLARDQYRKGDWIEARRNFDIAVAGNYKPGLFEDSPEKYLSRMDAKEQADAAKAANEQAMAQARAAQAPVMTPAQISPRLRHTRWPSTRIRPTRTPSPARTP